MDILKWKLGSAFVIMSVFLNNGGEAEMYRPIDMEKTGARIKEMLNRAGYDVKYIQSYLHLSCPQSIYRWFKGKTLPSVEHLSALSDLLHVNMNELLVLQGATETYRKNLKQYDPKSRRLLAYAAMLQEVA